MAARTSATPVPSSRGRSRCMIDAVRSGAGAGGTSNPPRWPALPLTPWERRDMVTHVERASAAPGTPLIRRILHRGAPAAGPPLVPGERRLLGERDAANDPVIASTRALYHRSADGPWLRLGWSEVSRFSWEPRWCMLDLTGLSTGAPPRLSLRLPATTRLPFL